LGGIGVGAIVPLLASNPFVSHHILEPTQIERLRNSSLLAIPPPSRGRSRVNPAHHLGKNESVLSLNLRPESRKCTSHSSGQGYQGSTRGWGASALEKVRQVKNDQHFFHLGTVAECTSRPPYMAREQENEERFVATGNFPSGSETTVRSGSLYSVTANCQPSQVERGTSVGEI
jgi:hypothetical protein